MQWLNSPWETGLVEQTNQAPLPTPSPQATARISRLERPGGLLYAWACEQARRTLAYLPRVLEDRRLLERLGGSSSWRRPSRACSRCWASSRGTGWTGWADWRCGIGARGVPGGMIVYLGAFEEGQGKAVLARLSSNFFG